MEGPTRQPKGNSFPLRLYGRGPAQAQNHLQVGGPASDFVFPQYTTREHFNSFTNLSKLASLHPPLEMNR